jgi:hypothetical protein
MLNLASKARNWNNGILEGWNDGLKNEDKNYEDPILPSSHFPKPTIPVFQHSIIPDGVVTTFL